MTHGSDTRPAPAPLGDRAEGSRSERGATAVEYAIMAGAITPVIVTTVALLGSRVDQLFQLGLACF